MRASRHPPVRRRTATDLTLLGLTALLLGLGLLMLYSSSAILAERQFGDTLFFVKRQLVWAALGLALMTALSRADYGRLREWVWPAVALSALLLVAVLFTPPVAGVRRWLRVGSVGLQPAEFAKLAALLYLCDYLDRRRSKLDGFARGSLVPLSVTGALLGLIALEPDLGTPALLFSIVLLVMFVAGSQLRYILAALACSLPVLAYELYRLPYRRRRVMSFLDPFSDPQGVGYQLVQSLTAVGSGGWLGRGLGASRLKLMHLPTPHTDFIFPIAAEELGLAGGAVILGLFTAFLLRGLRIARDAPDLFGTLLATALTLLISLQAYFNVAMSIGLLPTKGLPLPFFSYGGSSLLATLASVGVLMSISRQAHARGALTRRMR